MSEHKTAGRVTGAKPTGALLLVEILEAQEALGTRLSVGKKSMGDCPQAYILEMGPGVEKDKWGFEVGDRVLLQGNYNPLPNWETGRDKAIVECHTVKAVLKESWIETGD
jgi:hypothetical protein